MSEQTYSESIGFNPIDWNHRLDNAGNVIVEQLRLWAVDASESWVTCACGNQCKDIPRTHTGVPFDEDLRELGYQFGHAWQELADGAAKQDKHRFDEWLATARRTLAAIESRASEILDEMEAAP